MQESMRRLAKIIVFGGAALAGMQASVAQNTPPAELPRCGDLTGPMRELCDDKVKAMKKAAAAAGMAKGSTGKDAKLVNDTGAAADAKAAANDFAGAVAEYQKAIAASPQSPLLQRLEAGQAIMLRRQAIAAYNGGPQPFYPPAGASNAAIRKANADNDALVVAKVAAAAPLLKQAIEAASRAATLAAARKDSSIDAVIATELREDAVLLYRIDRTGVLAAPRASAEVEAVWLRRWLGSAVPPAEADVAKYGLAVAAAQVGRDSNAALVLADEVKTRMGNDPGGAMGFAEIVVAAKTSLGDPHRAAALAGLNATAATMTDIEQKRRLAQLKTALSVPS